MSSLSRMLSILDLFTEKIPQLSPSEISAALKLSRPTTYRYLKELTQAGLLSSTNGHYSLGPRIIQLDYQIRKADALLAGGVDEIRHLGEQFGGNVLVSSMYGETIVNTHHVKNDAKIKLTFDRGHLMPLATSATSKVMLAFLRRPVLKKLYHKYADAVQFKKIGADWPTFSTQMNTIRNRGFDISFGELDDDLVGIAAPIQSSDSQTPNTVTLILRRAQFALFNQEAVIDALMQCTQKLQATYHPPPAPEKSEEEEAVEKTPITLAKTG